MDDLAPLKRRTIALVGMMGVGKTSIGRRLALALALPFHDADEEIERASHSTITEIFKSMGEEEFRAGERRVIARLLDEPAHVLATGGGAVLSASTRKLLKDKAVTIWLKADVDILAKRVGRKTTRPLLADRDPRDVLAQVLEARAPLYGEADILIDTGDQPHQETVDAIIAALRAHVERAA